MEAAEPPEALVAELPEAQQLNEHQNALYLFSIQLESQMASVESADDFRERTFRAMQGPQDAGSVATERANRFLEHLQQGLILPEPGTA